MSRKAWALTKGSTFKSSVSLCQTCDCIHGVKRRRLTTSSALQSPKDAEDDLETAKALPNKSQFGPRAREKIADRQFFLDLLASASTKREAKGYLSRFKGSKSRSEAPPPPDKTQAGVKALAEANSTAIHFKGHTRAAEESPVFSQGVKPDWTAEEQAETLHIALIKIRAPQELNDATLDGVASTLSQLNRLGMGCCVVVDTNELKENQQKRRAVALGQANRVAAAIDRHPGPGTRRLDDVIGVSGVSVVDGMPSPFSLSHSESHVLFRKPLLAPLRRGIIPVLAPIAYTNHQVAVQVNASDVVVALTKEFAGLTYEPFVGQDPISIAHQIKALQDAVCLDRLILIDPLGGIPDGGTGRSSHVFVNMEQEYDGIRDDLVRKDDEELFVSSPAQVHLENLELLKNVLVLLPPSSSGMVTSPQDAANSSRASNESFEISAVGTRRQKNPLIHNLLTDKPMVSSSLPPGRLGPASGEIITPPPVSFSYPTTLFKQGMPLTIFPDPHTTSWTPSNISRSKLSLQDPKVDLPRLVHLIEDSFDRKLDIEHYLARVNDRIAGLIIAGEYEGGAILTWETPPGVDPDISKADPSRLVPYLDKFAVLKRSQGAGGVADILFNAMVRDCFPDGVSWRSRRDNPVNKWYFERARGTWKMPGTNWTMFWTTEGVVSEDDRSPFKDYEAVCRRVQPSWADNKAVVD